MFDRRYFEKVFSGEDPWGYRTCQYEKTKHQRQTELVRQFACSPGSILEIGCAEGAHTVMLADAFPGASILSIDISPRALERARAACRGRSSVSFLEADLTGPFDKCGLAERRFDVIIQSECLYYMFPTLFVRARLVRYFNDLTGTMKTGSIFVTSNGLHPVTRLVVGMFYEMMKRRADLVHDSIHREWNEVRGKYGTYDLKVFRLRG
ncbi:MAG: class I SAM-dependent methyltransferase [Chloroflexota bacterium]